MDQDLEVLEADVLAAMDCLVAKMSMLQPLWAVAGAGVHGISTVIHHFDYLKLKKIDRFIKNINNCGAERSEAFRVLMFPEHRKQEYAERIIHDIFLMDLDKKVDYFSYAGINVSVPKTREIFTESDFFRAGMVLAFTLKEDIDYLHNCDLSNSEKTYQFNEHVQGLVSAGLMYPFDGDVYKFTPFAKKIDCFALDEDGSKYGLDCRVAFDALPNPKYQFHAYWA